MTLPYDVPATHTAALEAENASLRELMNVYNLGGWTDSLTLIKERDACRERVKVLEGALNRAVLAMTTIRPITDWFSEEINVAARAALKDQS